MAASSLPPERPKVLLNKISRLATPPTRKERIMAAQRGGRRVEATSWRPTVLPRSGQPGPDKFVLVRAKLLGDNAIDDDFYLAVAATPKKFFEAALVDLTSKDPVTREMAFKTLHSLASEGNHDFTPESRYFVGECCLYGRGTPKDEQRATRWFQSVLPAPWPRGLLPIPNNAMAHVQFLLGEAFEFGEHGATLQPDIAKALTWYSRAALRGHIVAALAVGEILAQSAGTKPRPRTVNFDYFGANQTQRLSQGAGAVGVRRDGWKLAYFSDSLNNNDAVYQKARQYLIVLDLCSASPDRATLQWDLRLSDWDRGSNTPHTANKSTAPGSSQNSEHGNGNGGSPEDWPLLRCRAYLGLAILNQEGLGQTANLSKSVKLLQWALDAVGDKYGISLLRPPQHLAESFPSNLCPVSRKGGGHQQDIFPIITGGRGGRGKVVTGSTIILFNLALCYHFGRGVPQNLTIALRLYGEFKYRSKLGIDSIAGHRLWSNLASELSKHCSSLLKMQQQHIAKAALLLEG